MQASFMSSNRHSNMRHWHRISITWAPPKFERNSAKNYEKWTIFGSARTRFSLRIHKDRPHCVIHVDLWNFRNCLERHGPVPRLFCIIFRKIGRWGYFRKTFSKNEVVLPVWNDNGGLYHFIYIKCVIVYSELSFFYLFFIPSSFEIRLSGKLVTKSIETVCHLVVGGTIGYGGTTDGWRFGFELWQERQVLT